MAEKESAPKEEERLCQNCNKPISEKRLAALPDTTICIRCKRDNEAGMADAIESI